MPYTMSWSVMVYRRNFRRKALNASAERVCCTFQMAWERVLAPPQEHTQMGRGSSSSARRIRSSLPGESFPSPMTPMPARVLPITARLRR